MNQYSDDLKKEMFAKVVERQDGKTTAEKERNALCCDEWGKWINGWAAARNLAFYARVDKNMVIVTGKHLFLKIIQDPKLLF